MKKIQVTLDHSDDIRKTLTATIDDEPEPYGKMVSTGCTLLNMALSDRPDGGWMEGKYYWLVGDSQSGKTFFALTCFAEAQLNDYFSKHRLIFDNAEDGALMDIERFFGSNVARKIEPPRQHKGKPVFSETIEDFFFHVDDALSDGRPFIYVLDSMDALTSKDEQKKFQEHKKHARKKEDGEGGKDPSGSYGDGKAKKNSSGIRQIHSRLCKTPSILIIISQTRDNIDAGPWGESKTMSGGRALRFYATCLVMTSITGQITKKVGDRTRKAGHYVGLTTKKNRITGKIQTVQTAIYPSYGIDDIGSAIDWLVFERWWKKGDGGVIRADELKTKAKRGDLIHRIETSAKDQARLRRALHACWKRIEKESALDRPARYA